MSRLKAAKIRPSDSDRYLNRELSWLQFNRRVLEEAANRNNPLLERLRFLAIFESNLDEFYMVRVSGLIEQFESGILEVSPDGLSPNEQLHLIAEVARPLRKRAWEVFDRQIRPELEGHGIAVRAVADLTDRQKAELHDYFREEVFPLCTPLMLHPAASVPFISNRSLNLAVEALDDSGEMRLARVKVPTVLPRAIPIPRRKHEFVLLEDLIAANLPMLFPGVTLEGAYLFRVLRDADIEIRELEAADLITTIEQTIRLRRFGDPVLLHASSAMPERALKLLAGMLELDDDDVFVTDGILGFEVFHELAAIDKPDLRFPPHLPSVAEATSSSDALFEHVRQSDLLVHHPFDSFRSVEQFVGSAARDPNVVGIKQTLYRVGAESPIVESLLAAAEAGKQVAAMVELKARFDESNNLVWARTLERAGVHVTYGFADMKTHCKLSLIVRRERDGMRQYAHIGTGNYNPVTARVYTDIGLFTSDIDIAQDISELFNYLTGFSRQREYRKLLVAPLNLREGIIQRIRREAALHRKQGKGRLIFKLNALVDPEIIEALYEASEVGVKIDLIVRGVCCLRPGVPGMSSNIKVVSIVGRFLEHSRAFYFRNGGKPEAYIGSADLMRRNLDRRIEVLTPIASPKLVAHLKECILDVYLKDNAQAWDLRGDGEYVRRSGSKDPFNAQTYLMQHPTTKALLESP